MNTLEAIFTRSSTRDYSDKKIDKEIIHTLLQAGMSGPSCVNARDWAFVIVEEHETLCKMAKANGAPAKPLEKAALAILVCGDLNKAFKGAKDYWIIDASIACQNISIACQELGLGCVWLGTWPQMERVEAQKQLLDLPDHFIPHSILCIGYPKKECNRTVRDLYDENCVLWK